MRHRPTWCAAWAGLGYNRRAVNLDRAVVLMDDACRVTSTRSSLCPASARTRPGPCSRSAFEDDVAVVDTNIARCSRVGAGRRLSPSELQREADALVPAGRAWEWNQRLMDLGALVCTARDPSCDRCWLREGCAWDGELGRLAGSRRSWGQIGRAVGGSSLRSASGDVPVRELGVVMGWPDDRPRGERVVAGWSTRVSSRSVRP